MIRIRLLSRSANDGSAVQNLKFNEEYAEQYRFYSCFFELLIKLSIRRS